MGAADPILRSRTEHGRCDGHGGIAANLLTIDVTVQGNGHMMPAARRQRRSSVDNCSDTVGVLIVKRILPLLVCGMSRLTQVATVKSFRLEKTPDGCATYLTRSAQIHCVSAMACHPSCSSRQGAVSTVAGKSCIEPLFDLPQIHFDIRLHSARKRDEFFHDKALSPSDVSTGNAIANHFKMILRSIPRTPRPAWTTVPGHL